MHIFVTGATGFIGRALTKELISHGHTVLGLARSDANVETLTKLGATPHKGDLSDHESLKSGARQADAVIHLAFIHNFDDVGPSMIVDHEAIKAFGEALAGSGKPLVVASGTLLVTNGGIATEDSDHRRDGSPFSKRALSADLVYELSRTKQIRGMVVRISPTVHGPGDEAFITMLVDAVRKNGKAVYTGDGSQRWPAINLQDCAVLFRLAAEKGTAAGTYHAVGEEGVSIKDINRLIGEKLGVPVESVSHDEAVAALGMLAHVTAMDVPCSSAKTQKELGWTPTGPGLLQDMSDHYFARAVGGVTH